MTTGFLEHANFSVSDPHRTADMLRDLFGWHVRWEGAAIHGGHSVHVGTEDGYLALYAREEMKPGAMSDYRTVGVMNHIGVVVDDLDAVEGKVEARGFVPVNHADYEPGRRFYFRDHDGIEFEVVSYN